MESVQSATPRRSGATRRYDANRTQEHQQQNVKGELSF